ncbi:hypothetical protein FRC19_010656 [Serendipita sp. 401]|nr:hypothetical protein FRC19_010656 [Serendipita sp. 401]KAG9052381.1 hypothetical protein FS842_009950 [Serendipita sp. 407]
MKSPSFASLLERHEAWVMYLSITSFFVAIAEISFAALTIDRYSVSIDFCALGIMTLIKCFIMWRKWTMRVIGRREKPTSKSIYSIVFLLVNTLLALSWFIVAIMATTVTAIKEILQPYSWHIVDPERVWVQAFVAYIIVGLLSAEIILALYSRHHTLQEQQPPQLLESRRKTSSKAPISWVLGLIPISVTIIVIEFGLSFGDGSYGGSSRWLIPVVVALTLLLHLITLAVWKFTTKKRTGANTPPFVYSITLAVLTASLAAIWLAAPIVSYAAPTSDVNEIYYSSWLGDYFRLLDHLRPAAAALAFLISFLMWSQFGFIIYYRNRYFKRVTHTRNASRSTADTDITRIEDNGNATGTNKDSMDASTHTGQCELPTIPDPVYTH